MLCSKKQLTNPSPSSSDLAHLLPSPQSTDMLAQRGHSMDTLALPQPLKLPLRSVSNNRTLPLSPRLLLHCFSGKKNTGERWVEDPGEASGLMPMLIAICPYVAVHLQYKSIRCICSLSNPRNKITFGVLR